MPESGNDACHVFDILPPVTAWRTSATSIRPSGVGTSTLPCLLNSAKPTTFSRSEIRRLITGCDTPSKAEAPLTLPEGTTA